MNNLYLCTRGILAVKRFSFFFNVRTKTMRAWQSFEYGGSEKLQLNPEAQIPMISNSLDVLVKVHGASINPLDVEMLTGYGKTTFNLLKKLNNCSVSAPEFPLVLGRDFSGTVVHVGKLVKSFKIGDEVWGTINPWLNGSHSEYVLASACYISRKPNVLNHVEASSLPYAALTAWSAITCFGGLCEKRAFGKRVLVTGASGGVGTFAVQLLKSWGAYVIVTASSDATEMLYNLGADQVIDYQSPTFKQELQELKSLDLILDNVGKQYPELTIGLLKKWNNSKYVTLVSPLLRNADDRGLLFGTVSSGIQAGLDTAMSLKDGRSFRWAYFMPNGCALKKIAQLVDNNQVKPVIDKMYAFNDIPSAFAKAMEGHARGKTVVEMVPSTKIEVENAEKTEKQNV